MGGWWVSLVKLYDSHTNTIEEFLAAYSLHPTSFIALLQAMDYGAAFTGNMALYAQQAATACVTYLQTLYPTTSQAALYATVGLTPMIGQNDVKANVFQLADATALYNWAASNKIFCLGAWSMSRDTECPGGA